MSYEINGKLVVKGEIQHISDRFQKRDFVIEIENEKNPQWNDFIKVQLVQDRCDLIENINLNEDIKVYFNIKGTKWEKNGQTNYFTNIEGWKIERLQGSNDEIPPIPSYQEEDIPPIGDDDSIVDPF